MLKHYNIYCFSLYFYYYLCFNKRLGESLLTSAWMLHSVMLSISHACALFNYPLLWDGGLKVLMCRDREAKFTQLFKSGDTAQQCPLVTQLSYTFPKITLLRSRRPTQQPYSYPNPQQNIALLHKSTLLVNTIFGMAEGCAFNKLVANIHCMCFLKSNATHWQYQELHILERVVVRGRVAYFMLWQIFAMAYH